MCYKIPLDHQINTDFYLWLSTEFNFATTLLKTKTNKQTNLSVLRVVNSSQKDRIKMKPSLKNTSENKKAD